MKQIDYLKLVATGRSSSYLAKPSEQDDALRNFILFTGTASIGLTFAITVIISYLGTELVIDDVSFAMLASIAPFAYLLLASFFLSGARNIVLPLIYLPCFIAFVVILFVMARLPSGHWPMYVPPLIFVLLVARAALRNSQVSEQVPPESRS